MRFRFILFTFCLLMVGLLFCSFDSSIISSGATASVMSKSQTITDTSSQTSYIAERLLVTNRLDVEHAANVSLLHRNPISEEEFTSRSYALNNTKILKLAAIDDRYKTTNSIWNPLEVDLSITCNNPTTTNAVTELDILFQGGVSGTLRGYPDPLLQDETYHETFTFRTGKICGQHYCC